MTQGDAEAIDIYASGITPLWAWLSRLLKEKTEKFSSRQVAYADELNGVDSLQSSKKWWYLLEQEGLVIIRRHQNHKWL